MPTAFAIERETHGGEVPAALSQFFIVKEVKHWAKRYIKEKKFGKLLSQLAKLFFAIAGLLTACTGLIELLAKIH